MSDTDRMLFVDAKTLVEAGLSNIPPEDLPKVWHAYASSISYHHADDSGKEWGIARRLSEHLACISAEFDQRGIERPSRAGYLL
jgi:hypothetical protein